MLKSNKTDWYLFGIHGVVFNTFLQRAVMNGLCERM